MATRYTQLRRAVEILASDAPEQVRWLDSAFRDLTKGESAEVYGNDELLLCLDDIYAAQVHMIECGELSSEEALVIDKLMKLVDSVTAGPKDPFWQREALFSDGRWEQLRVGAQSAMTHLPDEQRESDWTRANRGSNSPKAIPDA